MSTKVNYTLESQKALKEAGLYKKALDGQWGEGSHKALLEAIALIPKSSKPIVSDPKKDGYVVEVVRFKQSARSTISRFSCNWNKITGYFLEPAGPETKEANKNRRIPVGVYNLVPHNGAKYKKVVRLYNENVSQTRAILIHQGNTPANTIGCLIAGSNYSEDYVGTSMAKLTELMTAIYAVGVTNVKVKIVDQIGK